MKGRAMPLNLSFLLRYGSRDFFVKMLEAGFTEVACGCGRRYAQRFRFAAVFSFYGPDDQVATWQVTKEKATGGGESDYVPPEEIRYRNLATFNEFTATNGITMGARINLAEVIGEWCVSEMTH